jgi:hypothetical protein
VQDGTGQTDHPRPDTQLTIVTHEPDGRELPWLRFLLDSWVGPIVDDPGRKLVQPGSLIVCERPDRMRGRVLSRIRRCGSIGLLHVGDEGYRARLDAYGAFAFVWRTHFHTALDGLTVRQLPIGPRGIDVISNSPTDTARKSPTERLYTWSFAGVPSTSRTMMVDAMGAVDGGHVQKSPAPDGDDPAALEVLADSVFAPCAMGPVHLESSRIYTALEVGAVPIVERRRWLDYFGLLLGDHPLPTVRSWSEAPELVGRLLANQQELASLQQRVISWWASTKSRLAADVQEDVEQCLVGLRTPSVFGPLDKPAPRWRNRLEPLRHRGP